MLHCFDYQAHVKRLIPMQKQPTYECRIPDISSLGGSYVHLHVNFSEMLAHSCFFAVQARYDRSRELSLLPVVARCSLLNFSKILIGGRRKSGRFGLQ